MKIRSADKSDSRELLEIYAQYINTPVTFEYTLPSEEEFSQRITDIGTSYPYLVCEENGRLIGYAYAHRYMERAAYQWNAELSVYIRRENTSEGLGKKLYSALTELLKVQGVKTVYGAVTVPNKKSEGLHLSSGFRLLGTYRSAGCKCGKWHDVSLFEKKIGEYEEAPEPIIPISEISQNIIDGILNKYSG